MKRTLHAFTFAALLFAGGLFTSPAAAEAVIKNGGTDALTENLATGAKTLRISSNGTLEWEDGATLDGAGFFRIAAGLVIGTNVQAYDADLTTWAGITPSANVQTLLGSADYAAFRTSLGLGTLAVESTAPVANGGTGQTTFTDGQLMIGNTTGNTLTKATLTAGSGITITNGNGSITIAATGGGGGLTIGTTTTSGAAANDLLISNGTVLQKITPGTGVATWLATPSSANLAAALTNETGTGSAVFGTAPTFTDSIIINQSGQSQTGGIRVAADPANGANRAIFIVPPSNNDRVYIGTSGQAAYSLNFIYCSGIENFPASVAKVGNLGFTLFGGGNINLDADFSGSGRVNVGSTTTAGVLQVNNTYTSATNFEGFRASWASNVASMKPVAGSGGGTVRTAQYYTTGTVFWSSGAGSPEGVVTAPVGSMFTRTDGGANTTLYVKESGVGNTGWIAK